MRVLPDPVRAVSDRTDDARRRVNLGRARWAAAGVALILVGIISATFLITRGGPQPIVSAPDSGTPQPTATTPATNARAAPTDGDTALWQLQDAASINSESTVLNLTVTRLGCASGDTGQLLAARITYEEQRVIIQVDAEPMGAGTFLCPGNNAVQISIELAEQIGERSLVDGGCFDLADTTNTVCANPTRWE